MINMNLNPFKKLIENDSSSGEKKKLNKEIANLCYKIIKLQLSGKLTMIEVKELEDKYKEYYEKFPNSLDYAHAKLRIKQLKTFAK
jgi:methyltransferase-like protein